MDLAAHFARVVATDMSPEQIALAVAHDRVEYRVASAEASGHDSSQFDLVTVAQAGRNGISNHPVSDRGTASATARTGGKLDAR